MSCGLLLPCLNRNCRRSDMVRLVMLLVLLQLQVLPTRLLGGGGWLRGDGLVEGLLLLLGLLRRLVVAHLLGCSSLLRLLRLRR